MNNRLCTPLKFVLLLLLTMLPAGVQADSCYKNFHVKLDAVPTGAGLVYLDYFVDLDAYPKVTITTPPTESVDEDITVQGSDYYACNLLAEPASGWELVGFTRDLKDEYAPEDFLGTDSPTEVVVGNFNPRYVFDAQSYEAAQEVGWDHADTLQYYAIFRRTDSEGILIPKTDDEQSATIRRSPRYNLSGQRVDRRFRGIVILDGKKVVRSKNNTKTTWRN